MAASHLSLAEWIPRPALFNASIHGKLVKFSKECLVAERVWPERDWKDGVVYTAQPVPVGEVWRITVKKTIRGWKRGLDVGVTTKLPSDAPCRLPTSDAGPHEWICCDKSIYHNKQQRDIPDILSLEDLTPGQSVGLLVTPNGQLHLFLNGEHGRKIATGLPVDTPLWGVTGVHGKCTNVKSEILTPLSGGPGMDPSSPKGQQVVEQLQQRLQRQDSEIRSKNSELQQKMREVQLKEQQLSDVRVKSSHLQQRYNTELREKNAMIQERDNTIQELQTQLQQRDAIIQEKNAELQQRDATIQQLQGEKDTELVVLDLQQRPQVAPQQIEFWQVSRQELQVREDKVLGRGAWGFVCEGYFRGQRVAIKCVYPDILLPHTHDRIRREIGTMAQVRHPNLVLFIAAVLEDRSGPKIITEILDTSLRSAYEQRQLGSNKLRIFRDVAAAMNYLHCQREPIIHRDLSTANVLLEAMAGEVWKAKVSDFGSANLVRLATTPGEGAIVYSAPEAFPQPPQSPTPHPAQTTKVDVYSYGVLLCEVILAHFPDSDNLSTMVDKVSKVWPVMHHLITNCIKWNPEKRPSMADILRQLDRMHE